jgi:uncharacterized membrane protein
MRPHIPHLLSPQWYRQGRLWVAPASGAGAAMVAGVAMLLLDHYVISAGTPFLPKYIGSAGTARTLLSATATSMATLTALVLTIVTVVVQLASDKYSHRALRTFLQDGQSHLTLAMFVGTFTYSVLALLGLDATMQGESSQVVGVTIPVAFALSVVSIGIFVRYIDHIVHAARGTSIIERIGNDTRAEIDRLYPTELAEAPPEVGHDLPADPAVVVPASGPGVVFELDVDGLVEWARAADVLVVIRPRVGDFTPGGAPLMEVHGEADHPDDITRFVRIDPERTITDDVGFGFRLLVDIGEAALSPGMNDPTTAVQCIDQLHDLLRRLATRHLYNGWHTDRTGAPRVFVTPRRWDDFVDVACEEIRIYGEGHLQVARRLRGMLRDLREIAPAERRAAVDRQLELLEASVGRGFEDGADRRTASAQDAQGIGGGVPDRDRPIGHDPDSVAIVPDPRRPRRG